MPSTDPTLGEFTNPSDLDVLIALRKDTHNYTSHLLFKLFSCIHLLDSYHNFISSVDSCSIPESLSKLLSHPGRKEATKEKMVAVKENGMWHLAPLLSERCMA